MLTSRAAAPMAPRAKAPATSAMRSSFLGGLTLEFGGQRWWPTEAWQRTQETSPPWAIESTRSAWQRRQLASTTTELSGRARMTSAYPPSVKAMEWCQPLRALTAYLETGPAGV